MLRDKLKSLAATLAEEADATTELPPKTQDNKITEKTFRPREALMARANSLKKAVKSLIDQTESGTCSCVLMLLTIEWLHKQDILRHYCILSKPYYFWVAESMEMSEHCNAAQKSINDSQEM